MTRIRVDRTPVVAPEESLVDASTPSGATPVGHAGWSGGLSFSDEFLGDSVSEYRWSAAYPPGGDYMGQSLAGNLSNGHGSMPSNGSDDEPQIYAPEGRSIVDGALRLTMSDGAPPEWPTFDFTSGMVCSYPAFSQAGGYFESRIRCVAVDGAWPAFWLLSDSNGLQWPPEIDIMETWGESPSWVNHAVWYTDMDNDGNGGDVGTTTAWHTYGAWVEPGVRVRFYVDGSLVSTVTDSRVTEDNMFIVLNLAGDHRPGLGPSPADMPFSIDVDYVRVWAA